MSPVFTRQRWKALQRVKTGLYHNTECKAYVNLTINLSFDSVSGVVALSCGPQTCGFRSPLRMRNPLLLKGTVEDVTRDEREDRGRRYRTGPSGTKGAHAAGGGDGERLRMATAGTAEDERAAVCSALSHLFLRDDGWLRACPSTDGKRLYLRWKFTRGKWRGFYVMTCVAHWQWGPGCILLLDKCEQVDLGVRVPTKDTPYEYGDEAAYARSNKDD